MGWEIRCILEMVQVRLSLCLFGTMPLRYIRNGDTTQCIFNLGTRWRWMVSLTQQRKGPVPNGEEDWWASESVCTVLRWEKSLYHAINQTTVPQLPRLQPSLTLPALNVWLMSLKCWQHAQTGKFVWNYELPPLLVCELCQQKVILGHLIRNAAYAASLWLLPLQMT